MGEAKVNPSALPLISADARKNIAEAIAGLKSGNIAGHVVAAVDRATANEYAASTDRRALVITDLGSWYWRTGDTTTEAIATAAADCQKGEGQGCLLYAVNDRVVFTP